VPTASGLFSFEALCFCFCRCWVKRKGENHQIGCFDVSWHQQEESFGFKEEPERRREAVSGMIYSKQLLWLILRQNNYTHSHTGVHTLCRDYFFLSRLSLMSYVVGWGSSSRKHKNNTDSTCLTAQKQKLAAVKHSNTQWSNENSDLIWSLSLISSESSLTSPAADWTGNYTPRLQPSTNIEFLSAKRDFVSFFCFARVIEVSAINDLFNCMTWMLLKNDLLQKIKSVVCFQSFFGFELCIQFDGPCM